MCFSHMVATIKRLWWQSKATNKGRWGEGEHLLSHWSPVNNAQSKGQSSRQKDHNAKIRGQFVFALLWAIVTNTNLIFFPSMLIEDHAHICLPIAPPANIAASVSSCKMSHVKSVKCHTPPLSKMSLCSCVKIFHHLDATAQQRWSDSKAGP